VWVQSRHDPSPYIRSSVHPTPADPGGPNRCLYKPRGNTHSGRQHRWLRSRLAFAVLRTPLPDVPPTRRTTHGRGLCHQHDLDVKRTTRLFEEKWVDGYVVGWEGERTAGHTGEIVDFPLLSASSRLYPFRFTITCPYSPWHIAIRSTSGQQRLTTR
jgi:hypothetical protein